MFELNLVLGVAFMFFLRIGVPLIVLITLSTVIDRWQTQREVYIREHYPAQSES